MSTFPHTHQHQHGAALMVSLLILIVLTMLGLTGLGTTTLEERMTVAMQHMELTFQSSEAGINDVVVAATQEFTVNGHRVKNLDYVAASDPLLTNQTCQAVATLEGYGGTSTLGKTTLTTTVDISYRGERSGTSLTGASVKYGSGFVEHVFDIDSEAVIASSTTKTKLRQGVALIREGSGACTYLAQ